MSGQEILVAGRVGKLAVTITDGDPELTPVCFIHPINTAGAVWAEVAGRLQPPRRCALPDLRGHGTSVFQGPFTVDDYAADVVAVLDGVGFDRAHLVGASLGGPVAVALAATIPDRVASVSALGSALTFRLGEAELSEIAQVLDTQGVRALFTQLAPAALGSRRRDELRAHAVDLTTGTDRPPRMVYDIVAAAFSTDVTPLAARVGVPCVVANGDEDTTCTPAHGDTMGAALRARTVVAFAGVGHLPMLEIPDEVAALLDQHFPAGDACPRRRER